MSEKMAHHHLLNLLIYSCSLLLPDSKNIFLRSITLHSFKVLLLVLSFFNYPIRVLLEHSIITMHKNMLMTLAPTYSLKITL